MITEKRNAYMREYRKKNKEKIAGINRRGHIKHREERLVKCNEWRQNNPIVVRLSRERRRVESPWYYSFHHAKARCTNPKIPCYQHYGGRGIEFKMTMEDFEHLWYRDFAFMMDRPSIDRKKNDGHYELDNCRFIELSANVRKRNLERGKIKDR